MKTMVKISTIMILILPTLMIITGCFDESSVITEVQAQALLDTLNLL
jgi:hypothetical protein